jgi:hypothetical protein
MDKVVNKSVLMTVNGRDIIITQCESDSLFGLFGEKYYLLYIDNIIIDGKVTMCGNSQKDIDGIVAVARQLMDVCNKLKPVNDVGVKNEA